MAGSSNIILERCKSFSILKRKNYCCILILILSNRMKGKEKDKITKNKIKHSSYSMHKQCYESKRRTKIRTENHNILKYIHIHICI